MSKKYTTIQNLIPKRVTLIKRSWVNKTNGARFTYLVKIWNPTVKKHAEIALKSRDKNGAITEAFEVYSKHAGDINAGRDVSKRRYTIRLHLDEFIEFQKVRSRLGQITPERVVVIEHALKTLEAFSKLQKNPPLDMLAKVYDNKFLAHRSKATAWVTGNKLTARTLNTELNVHRQFFRWAIENNISTRPLMTKDLKVTRSNKPFPTKSYAKFLSVGQKEIEKSKSPKTKFDLMNYRTVVMVMNSIGCRVTEIKNMKWTDITHSKGKTELYIHGKSKERTIQIPERVAGHLETLKKFKQTMGKAFEWNEVDYPFIFSTYRSKTVSKSFSNRTRRRWAEKAGIEGEYDLVCFRHKFITDALNKGVHSLSVASYTGTSQLMIEKTYSGLVSSDVFNLVFKNAPVESLSRNNPAWVDKLIAD